jgi:hypothetical protein
MRYHGFSVDALINRKVLCILKERENTNCYINCDPLLSFGLSYVDFTGVDVRFVHIEREVEGFARSMINWQFTKTKSWIAHNLIPFWQPDVWPFEHALHLFHKGYLKNKYSRVWRTKNGVFVGEFRKKYPYLRIQFEKLFDYEKGEQTFARLVAFMGLDIAFHSSVFFDKENASVPRFCG